MTHIEMIIDYIIDGTDFQYNDNHGVLVRCKDCRHASSWTDTDGTKGYQCEVNFDHMGYGKEVDANDFCSYGERGEQE